MKIVFSRKGFDGSSGGTPSPIVDGRPISLPIPTTRRSTATYESLGLGPLVEHLTRGRYPAGHLCHADPDLAVGALGQVGRAQSHLATNSVGTDDVFLFFGLFREATLTRSGLWFTRSSSAHHRVFGWLQVGEVIALGENGTWLARERSALRRHPHARDGWEANNTLYLARRRLSLRGRVCDLPGHGIAQLAAPDLQLTAPDGAASLWTVPAWLDPCRGGVGMTYHRAAARWDGRLLRTVGRGQEFIADAGDRADAVEWLEALIRSMER